MRKREWFTIAVISLCLDAITFTVFWGIHKNENPEPQKVVAQHYGPKIPQCDKPLWERIKDGC